MKQPADVEGICHELLYSFFCPNNKQQKDCDWDVTQTANGQYTAKACATGGVTTGAASGSLEACKEKTEGTSSGQT